MAVDAKLDRSAIRVGEQAQLTTTVTAPAAKRVKFRDFSTADTLMTGVEVVACGDIDTLSRDGGRLRLQRIYTITSFDSALYALPPMQVEVDGKQYASRNKLGLKVSSIPVDTTHVDQFEPPFTVVEEPFALLSPLVSWEGAVMWIVPFLPWLFLFLSLFAAVRLTGHKPLRRKVTIKPPTPPYKKAADAMEQLRPEVESSDAMLMSDEQNKQFFVRLTDILRLYLADRYGFNAQEKTTQEICDGLREGYSEQLDAAALEQLHHIFTTADFVKFAKHTATDVERRQAFKAVADFLSATRDEEQERPRPIIRYVTFSDQSLHRVRVALWVTLIASAVLLVASTAYAVYMLCDTYL